MDPTALVSAVSAALGTIVTVGLAVWAIAIRQGRRIGKLEDLTENSEEQATRIGALVTEIHGLGVKLEAVQRTAERTDDRLRQQNDQVGELRAELGMIIGTIEACDVCRSARERMRT